MRTAKGSEQTDLSAVGGEIGKIIKLYVIVEQSLNRLTCPQGGESLAKKETYSCEKCNKKADKSAGFLSEPAGTRTQGPYIKSVLLYQLSYEFNPLRKTGSQK